jgi:hypothetical protein
VSGQDLERLMKANESACVARQSFPFGPGNTRNRDHTTNLQGAAALHAQRNMRTAIENDPRFEGTPFTATTAAAVRLTRGGACAEFAEAAFAEHAAKLEPGHVVERRSRPEEIKHNTHGWVAERPPGADDAHQLVLDSWAEGVAPFQPDSHLRDTRYRVLQSAAPDDAPVIRQAIEDTIRDTADLQQLANETVAGHTALLEQSRPQQATRPHSLNPEFASRVRVMLDTEVQRSDTALEAHAKTAQAARNLDAAVSVLMQRSDMSSERARELAPELLQRTAETAATASSQRLMFTDERE